MAHAFKCHQNTEAKDLLLLECMDERGLNAELETHRSLLGQFHLDRQRKGWVTGTQSHRRGDSQNRITLWRTLKTELLG